ncbi:MAG: hypothetical protein AAFO29_07705 [Actinomycetota bacterium]
MSFGVARGVVTDFDVEVGLGTIVDADQVMWPFHCTAIADGSRTIEVGVEVTFDRTWGGPGRWEAASVTP